MLIKLVPDGPLPTVLFAVSFPDIKDEIPISNAWMSMLQTLQQEDLELPKTMHSLDRAAGIPSLLNEVSFDIPAMTISCHFVDGAVEEWPLGGDGLLSLLGRVAEDVSVSSRESERQKEAERDREKERERERRKSDSSSPGLPPPVPARTSRHRKQRSLIMTLVASFVSLSSFSSSSSSRLPSPPPTPITSTPPRPAVSSRALRRRARSTLVDTFRMHVLTELSRRFPQGGYYTWILQSMLRRVTQHMERLVESTGGWTSPDLDQYYPEHPEFFSITAASLPPTPPTSDDEGDDLETDTDGSSVHTPSTSHFNPARLPPLNDYALARSSQHHALPSPRRYLSENDHAVYTELARMTSRLRRLLIQDQTRQRNAEEDLKHHYIVLEIRSRRRAWLNKALSRGIGTSMSFGMAAPSKSSPLAQRSWTAEQYEYAPNEDLEDAAGAATTATGAEPAPTPEYRFGAKLRRMRSSSSNSKLFPVTEEEIEAELDGSEDEAHVARELELHFQGFDVDLEGGVMGPEDEETGGYVGGSGGCGGGRHAFEAERQAIRPRVRTSSMRGHRLNAPIPVEIGFVPSSLSTLPSPQQHSLPLSPVLFQPLPVPMHHTACGSQPDAYMNQQPPAYSEVAPVGGVDIAGLEGVGGYGEYQAPVHGHGSSEFTLAMDLPYSVRVRDRTVFTGRKRVHVNDTRWLPESPVQY